MRVSSSRQLDWGGLLLAIILVVPIRAQTPQKPDDSGAKSSSAADEKTVVPGKDGTTMPSCYYMPHPPYTKEARDAKYEGTVLVQGVVTLDERIMNLRIVKSPGLGLSESVLTTLKTWKCKPATHDGKPVPALVPFEITFRLKQGN